MALNLKPGQSVQVKITKHVSRASAVKTLERLFLKDEAIAGPIEARSANFKELPKRRGGVIWTKRPNKVHPDLKTGASATVLATPQAIKDLNSVATFVNVTSA